MGIYNIPDEQYRAMTGLSQSRTKRLLVSGKNYLAPPPASSDAFRVGSLIDQMVLTPEVVDENFVVTPDFANHPDNKTADGKRSTSTRTGYVKDSLAEFGRANVGKQFISSKEWAFCRAVADDVLAKKFMKNFAADTTSRTQVAMDGKWAGVPIKGLADGLTNTMLFDLKTCRDSNIKEFRRSFFKFGYGFQLRFYLDLCWQNRLDIPMENCFIVAAGKQDPTEVCV